MWRLWAILAALVLLVPGVGHAATHCDAFVESVEREGVAAFPRIAETGRAAGDAAWQFVQGKVGLMALDGDDPDGPRRCVESLARLLTVAAEDGEAEAQRWLAHLYTGLYILFETPDGERRSNFHDRLTAEGHRWALAAAAQEDEAATWLLVKIYQRAYGAQGSLKPWTPPLGEVLAFLRTRADAGSGDAHVVLGLLFAFGRHVAFDPLSAQRHFDRAAELLGFDPLTCAGPSPTRPCRLPLSLP
jgi:hypothetical protein